MVCALAWLMINACPPQQEPPPEAKPQDWLADRGDGIHTSLFGTYVREKEFLLYVFYEYNINHDAEYQPSELGFSGDEDFTARRVEHEALVFIAYGFAPDWMVEFESALYTRVTQEKSADDTSAMPNSLTESGLGDTEGQLRWRFLHETETLPEFIAFLEVVFPLQRNKVLIGTQDWEFEAGVFITKGFSWGTLGLKLSLAYDTGEDKLELGEYAIEYVKRLSDDWRLVLSIEGEQDEVQFIVEAQWQIARGIVLKLNSGFGLTPKAEDWSPEIGLLFSF